MNCDDLPLSEGVCWFGVRLEVALPKPLAQGSPLSSAVHHCQLGSDWTASVTFAVAGTPEGGEEVEEDDELEDEEPEVEPEDGVLGCADGVPEAGAGALEPSDGWAGVWICGREEELEVAGDPPQPTHASRASELSASSRCWRIVDERGNSFSP